jgi:hypothetical protein
VERVSGSFLLVLVARQLTVSGIDRQQDGLYWRGRRRGVPDICVGQLGPLEWPWNGLCTLELSARQGLDVRSRLRYSSPDISRVMS